MNNTIEKTDLMVNIMVCGKAGVGKTVLINTFIGAESGETGIGKPVTKEINSYISPGSPLRCYDTPGFEIKQGQTQQAIKEFVEKIKDLQHTMDGNEMIDVIIYCICYQGPKRIEATEIEFIKLIRYTLGIPVVIAFTQFSGNPATWEQNQWHLQVKTDLEDNGCALEHFMPVMCYDMVEDSFDGVRRIPSFGMDKLIDVVFDVAQGHRYEKLAGAKRQSLEESCRRASRWVIFYSGTAAAEVALVAVPGADVAVLTANEAIMATHIYDIVCKDSKIGNYDKEEIVEALTNLAVPIIGGIAGPIIFNEAIKVLALFLAPVTGALSEAAAVAAGAVVGFGVTFALGNTTIDLLRRLYTGNITLEEIKNKDSSVVAQAKNYAKQQYYVAKEYAKEHPDQIRKNKKRSNQKKE